MSGLERGLGPLRRARRRLRFGLWALELELQLRRRGGRLVLEAAPDVRFESPPHVEVAAAGDGDGTTTLRIGRGVTLGRGTVLDLYARGTNLLELGDGVSFGNGNRIQLRSGAIRLGSGSNVRDFTLLKSSGELVAGRDVAISNGAMLHCTLRVELGDRVGIAERVSVLDTDHQADGSDAHFYTRPIKVEAVRVEPNVFIAANAVVLCGARIGRNSVVAANAVVPAGEHPPGHVLAGAPARAVKRLPKAPAA